MKRRLKEKKLNLGKKTITNLSREERSHVMAGEDTDHHCGCLCSIDVATSLGFSCDNDPPLVP